MVLTSHEQMGQTGKKTGFWLEEFAAPYYAFIDADAEVTLASIKGGQPPIDPKSNDEESQTETTRRFMADSNSKQKLQQTLPIDRVKEEDYDAIFLPGGHGTMWDFPDNPILVSLIETFDRKGKVVAAVCHAPAALVSAKDTTGNPLVANRKVTGFTDSEERAVQLEEVVPFLLETRLRELGATFVGGADFQPLVCQSGTLITGQNPASSAPAAEMVLQTLVS
ncbi:type 1 glutamine amidotransferase domain-containing protein [Lusitaniella coriacea]|uniref:type 1 glutamine amidotransferase domain-containing protein n=1 Tax=Lusitaniella coriacea TaxID=1983105 RepID=UPI003CF81842